MLLTAREGASKRGERSERGNRELQALKTYEKLVQQWLKRSRVNCELGLQSNSEGAGEPFRSAQMDQERGTRRSSRIGPAVRDSA